MTTAYAYGTAHSVVMVGAVGAQTAHQIGPTHAIPGQTQGRSRRALCGAYVAVDEQCAWPPAGHAPEELCADCAERASGRP